MSTKDKIYVSYSHPVEETTKLVEQLEAYCKDNASFEIVREKDQVDIGESFNDYMRKIGRGWLVLVILSDEYFQSENCLYELLELHKNKKIDQQGVISIIVGDYRCDDSSTITKHIEYWKSREAQFNKDKLSKELIRKTCQANAFVYAEDGSNFDDLVAKITDVFEAKRAEEKRIREEKYRKFRLQCIEEINKQQQSCPELKSQIDALSGDFVTTQEALSAKQLKTSLSNLCIAVESALNDAEQESTIQNICKAATQIFSNLIILGFEKNHFVNRPVNFEGEVRLLYKIPVSSQTTPH